MNFTGIDVSKLTLSCYDGKNYYEIANIKDSVASLVSKASRENTRLIYEATGPYSLLLDFQCALNKVTVYRVNPRDSKHFSQAIKHRNKNDLLDAKMLWNIHKITKEDDWEILSQNKLTTDIEELFSYYNFLQKRIVATKNRLKSQKFKQNNWIIKELEKELRYIKDTQNKVIEKMKKAIQKDKELASRYSCCQSIKGIAEKSALVLTLFFLKYPNMNKKELIALAGLDPVETTSGTSVKKKSRISKRGAPLLRKMLFMPIVSMTYRNKAFHNHLQPNA